MNCKSSLTVSVIWPFSIQIGVNIRSRKSSIRYGRIAYLSDHVVLVLTVLGLLFSILLLNLPTGISDSGAISAHSIDRVDSSETLFTDQAERNPVLVSAGVVDLGSVKLQDWPIIEGRVYFEDAL